MKDRNMKAGWIVLFGLVSVSFSQGTAAWAGAEQKVGYVQCPKFAYFQRRIQINRCGVQEIQLRMGNTVIDVDRAKLVLASGEEVKVPELNRLFGHYAKSAWIRVSDEPTCLGSLKLECQNYELTGQPNYLWVR